MRIKTLDVGQWGLPIVSTTIGAEGVTIRPGENILYAPDRLRPDISPRAILDYREG